MKKGIGIVIFIVIVIISLGLSIYLPNKDKINDEAEDKSVIYSVIEENGKYGVKNQDEKVIVKPQYEQVVIPNEHRGIFICDNDGEKTVVYNEKGSEILKDYDAVEPIKLSNLLEEKYEKNAIIYQKNGKYGLLSITGKVILDARYEQIYSLGYKENEVIVKDNNKYKIYDVKGKQLIKDEFDSIQSDEYYNEQDEYKKSGYIVCKTTSDGYRYGYYDYDYDQVLTTDYNQILRIVNVIDKNNVYLIASKNGQYGVFINNVKIINTQYQTINYEKDFNLFIAERTGKYGAFNEKGNEVLKVEYDSLEVKGIYIYATKGEEKKVFDKDGKEAITHFKVLGRYKNKYTLLQINLETGRTHQIRVHLSQIGYPVIGDNVYSNGKNKWGIEGQCLHSKSLKFKHPITGKEMFLEARLPEYFEKVLKELREKEK